jgi:hypothetical protein
MERRVSSAAKGPARWAARAFALVVTSAVVIAASAPASSDHVCAEGEGKGPCPLGRVRMCTKDGALATCACPPGQIAAPPSASCTIDAAAKAPSCVVVSGTVASIGDALGASLELGELEVPTLPSLAPAGASDAILTLDPQWTTLDADGLVKLAAAHQAMEGAAAYEASGATTKIKAAPAVARRDTALGRTIEVRRAFLGRFPKDPRAPSERVSLARALLRRAAYAGGGTLATIDRGAAHGFLVDVVDGSPATTSARTAAFLLGEESVRARTWASVVIEEDRVLKWSLPKTDADDHAYLAAAWARLGQARLALGDPNGAKAALVEAISAGVVCAPRAECVSAAAASRSVIDRVWATTGSPPRTLAKVLEKGTMPKQERTRPMVRLADLFGTASGSGCAEAAEEARAFVQVLR